MCLAIDPDPVGSGFLPKEAALTARRRGQKWTIKRQGLRVVS